MEKLYFKTPYLQPIRKGKIRAVARLDHNLNIGEEVLFLTGHVKAKVLITGIEWIDTDALEESDAVKVGFRTIEQMIGSFKEFNYNMDIAGIFIIDFDLIDSYQRKKNE